MNPASLIKLFEELTVEEMRGLIREFDATGRIRKAMPNRPSVIEMSEKTVVAFDRDGLVDEALFDRLAEMLPRQAVEVQRVRNLSELEWQADSVFRSARDDAETAARDLVERVQAQVKETEEALAIAVRTASLRTKELNDTVERATAAERALEALRAEADALLAGLRGYEAEAEGIVAELRDLSPEESETRERKREQAPDLFDRGEVRRPKMKGLLWAVGATITVRFIGGSDEQRSLTRAAAEQWAEHANLDFAFTDEDDAMVRVSFEPVDGSWAYLGTNALGISADQPTMNLGWVERAPESALHEFGHVLGLIHEFQSPNSPIEWDLVGLKAAHNFLSDEQIKRTVTDRVSVDDYPDYRDFDLDSIMMFTIPASWVRDGEGFIQSRTLSDSDKAFIRRLYPFPEEDGE